MHRTFIIAAAAIGTVAAVAQELYTVKSVEVQPLVAQAQRLVEALDYLGSPLPAEDAARVRDLTDAEPTRKVAAEIQEILDPYCLAMLHVNPEARTKTLAGPAEPTLRQSGWTSYLVKVHNEAGVRSEMLAQSPNSLPVLHRSSSQPQAQEKNLISPGELSNRFMELVVYRGRPLNATLSGLELEYQVLQIYSKDTGKREARINFSVGAGTEDLGERSGINVLFDCKPSVQVMLEVLDEDDSPTMASFIIRDNVERIVPADAGTDFPKDYRHARAMTRPWESDRTPAKRLRGIYPLPARRVAATDEYPDFFFQPQVYRGSGEHVYLTPGEYEVTVSRGPEYLEQSRVINVSGDNEKQIERFKLERWINMSALGWYSGDHHVHAAGCSHYESPEEGVNAMSMFRQGLGEDLNVSCVLSWGPCWYHQKENFEGKDNAVSIPTNLVRYDVEVSGFPSSHAGHLCLLRLKEDDYPGTTKIEEWPSWTQPVLQWGQSQGAVVGYSHSGWGLEPTTPTNDFPNYVLPKMDGIGANEYIVTVANGACDFISSVDTPATWELNIWYHTLNCGYRARISGETDFPCIFDTRVGMGRSYCPLDKALNFDEWCERIRQGANYVSDGKSHIIDFKVNDVKMGEKDSELRLKSAKTVSVSAKVAGFLPETQTEEGAVIAKNGFTGRPYWDIEKARIGATRTVPVEVIVNGYPAGKTEISADGTWNDVTFDVPIEQSSWIALRVLPSSHTNPVFVLVGDKPIRASRRSAQWCIDSVEQCWKMKEPAIRDSEKQTARTAYDMASAAYERALAEATAD